MTVSDRLEPYKSLEAEKAPELRVETEIVDVDNCHIRLLLKLKQLGLIAEIAIEYMDFVEHSEKHEPRALPVSMLQSRDIFSLFRE